MNYKEPDITPTSEGIMACVFANRLLSSILLAGMPYFAHAQTPPPIIDMHVHAEPVALAGPSVFCAPYEVMPVANSGAEAPAAVMEWMTKPDCENLVTMPADDAEQTLQLLAIMERRNVISVVGGDAGLIAEWTARAPGRWLKGIPSSMDVRKPEVIAELRRRHAAGELDVIAEVATQYEGVAPDDPSLEPLWALAEELDVPVGIHVGTGPPGAPYFAFPQYRGRLHSPLAMEEVVMRHPKLRVWLMHAGWPMLDDLLVTLYTHPQIHVDIGAIAVGFPKPSFYRYLQAIVDAGFIDRVMFGSDMFFAPEMQERAIQVVEEAPFLDEAHKRAIFYDNAARFLRFDEDRIQSHHQGQK
ncbi:amidohydrolase family protein [Porphyrobacter sp. AAP60]|uniref:amidohydrolase family protein n=1 Tax=Porphyrobacter sp. AAP60 TaxID=1523423 RepID=UPI0009EA949C|nr:amidohydrolase family protein [Porphyrobacter sp. AAP60]